MLTHQAADLLVINDQALLAKRSLDATPAIVLELVADSGDRLNDRSIIGRLLRAVIVSRARNPHQPTSFRDGEAAGPVIADVGSLLLRGRACRAPFRNSSSRACFPTSLSRAAIRAS